MRYKDIPQFVRDGPYTVDHPLGQLVDTINRYQELGLQINPDFQRGHVWNDEQSSRYVEFLFRGGQSGRLIYLNHPGWLNNYKGEFVLVDGLQRVTACLKFLNNELPIFGHLRSEFEGRIDILLTLKFNINTLPTRAQVLQWYLDLNDGGVVHSSEELDKVRVLLSKESHK